MAPFLAEMDLALGAATAGVSRAGASSLAELAAGEAVQFERLGYFCPDPVDDSDEARVFNRVVTLRDSWAKIEKQAMQGQS